MSWKFQPVRVVAVMSIWVSKLPQSINSSRELGLCGEDKTTLIFLYFPRIIEREILLDLTMPIIARLK
jgi:hypothetical protein